MPASALRPTGSTAAWRRLRLFILDRDGWTCRVPDEWGRECGVPLTTHNRRAPTHATVDHVVTREQAPPGFDIDAPSNLRAACQRCNGRRSAEQTNDRRAGLPTSRW